MASPADSLAAAKLKPEVFKVSPSAYAMPIGCQYDPLLLFDARTNAVAFSLTAITSLGWQPGGDIERRLLVCTVSPSLTLCMFIYIYLSNSDRIHVVFSRLCRFGLILVQGSSEHRGHRLREQGILYYLSRWVCWARWTGKVVFIMCVFLGFLRLSSSTQEVSAKE